jgi:hypothetical protein
MCKRILKNAPLYLLTLANIIYAIKHGFDWLSWFAIGLTAIVLVWDIVEVIQNRRKG